MPQTVAQCTNCGAFTRRSLHHEDEYRNSVLLERLRTSNFPATDEEISLIRYTLLPTVSDDISSIDAKVASLREVITSMEEERERLISVQKRYNHLISLHRALPSEIWSEIFLYTLSTPSDSNAFNAFGSMWQLSRVCQKWRNIALSCHSFWSTIRLYFPKAAQQEGDVKRLETIIQRSRQGPLDISLTSSSQKSRSDPSIQQCIIDILLAESYRWQKLHLSDDGGGLNMLYAQLHNRLPRLECLSLHSVNMEPKEQSIFKGCPCLTKLTLSGSPSRSVVEFPWDSDQIMEVDLSNMYPDGDEEEIRAYMHLIGLCSSLEILSLPYWYLEDEEVVSPYTPTICSNVRKLTTRSVRVLDALTLPRLQEASFHPRSTMGHHDALYVFEKLLIRSNALSALTSLSLHGVPLAASPSHTLHHILSQTHSLTFFKAAVYMEDEDDETDADNFSDDEDQIVMVVKSLEVVPTKTVTFLPLLSSLDIRMDHGKAPTTLPCFRRVHRFASTIKARWRGDDSVGLARLRTCHFSVHAQHLQDSVYRDPWSYVPHIFDEAERSIFNALINDGMDLTIRVTSRWAKNAGGDKVVFSVPG